MSLAPDPPSPYVQDQAMFQVGGESRPQVVMEPGQQGTDVDKMVPGWKRNSAERGVGSIGVDKGNIGLAKQIGSNQDVG